MTDTLPPRLIREQRTIAAMVALYCRDHHASSVSAAGPVTPCAECQALLDYAAARLERCPFQAAKPTCAKCTVHCYKPEQRRRVRAVMRYAGPRMLLRHPGLAVRHLIDGLRKAPALKRRAAGGK